MASTAGITGSGLSGATSVTLNGAPVRILSSTDTSVVVKLNSWNTTGRFEVSLPGWVKVISSGVFTVT